MPKLLHIQSSPNLEKSITRTLSCEFVEAYLASHPDMAVELLDLAADPLPHWGPEARDAFITADENDPAQREALALSEKLITQLESAQVIVIGCPMYNMSMPTQLKSWIDYVSRPGRTFNYRGPYRSDGLIAEKKAFVILSRGGDYSQPPASAADFQEPLLRANLGLIGIEDVQFVRAEGQRLQEAPSYIAAAREAIAALVQ